MEHPQIQECLEVFRVYGIPFIVEVPNPGHPYGVRGVGETSICPPLAAIANAVSNAAGVRMKSLPMSPPRILKALDDA